jgi:hypothetical protein
MKTFLCMLGVGLCGFVQAATPATEEALQSLLARTDCAHLIPELGESDQAVLRSSAWGRGVLDWAASAEKSIPQTTRERYLEFQKSGARPPYERPYFEKRRRLTQFVMRAWLEPDQADLEQVRALLESVLEEPTWVLPAHEKEMPWNIDLFSAETGCDLAHVLLLLGDRLPEDLTQRMRAMVKARILDPYLAHGREFWWDKGRNNWTGVCAGAVGQTFLLLEPDTERQAKALSAVLGQLERFLREGFEEDGACLEGVGYWNYGLSHFVSLAAMLNARTQGEIDLLAHPKLQKIAAYPAAVALDKNIFAAFSDSHEHSAISPYLAARLSERTGTSALLSQMGGPENWRVALVLRNLLWWDGAASDAPEIVETYLPGSGIIKLVGEAQGTRLVLAAKAGHNGEPHNNNDVGSFILRIGGVTYLCDPGGGLYSKDYFSGKRYENIFANSFGHSVPRIHGELQATGAEHAGALTKEGPSRFRIRFEGAYRIPQLQKAERQFTLSKEGAVTMTARYRFSEAMPVEEAFLSWLPVEVEGSIARIRSAEGVLELEANAGRFQAERLEQACKENSKKRMLTRVTLHCDSATQIDRLYTMRYRLSR